MLIALFWTGLFVASLVSLRALIYFTFVLIAFNAFNCIPASVNLLPSTILSPFLFFYMIFQRGYLRPLSDAAFRSDAVGYLTAYTLVGLIVTMSAPFLFEGTTVVSLNTTEIISLTFGTSNITQLTYVLTGFFFTLALTALLQDEQGRRSVVIGILLGAASVLLAGLTDMATFGTSLLDPVRSANYAILKDSAFGDIGMNRVIGFSPEASAYSPLTLGFAAILLLARPTQLIGMRWSRIELALGIALVVMTYLTTSSAGYVGLAVLAVVWLFATLVRLIGAASANERAEAQMALVGMAGVLLLVIALLVVRPDIVDRAYRVLDTIVLSKSKSESYIGRSGWNRDSFHALLETYGYGLGLGSTRTSSWLVALVTSTGFLGGLLMAVFLAGNLLGVTRLGSSPMARVAQGAGLATLVSLTSIVGTAPAADFGVCVAIGFGLMAGGRMLLRNAPQGNAPQGKVEGGAKSGRSQPDHFGAVGF